MSGVKDPALFSLFHDYFAVHLSARIDSSEHTIKSYRDSMNSLLDFVKKNKGVELYEITFDMIDSELFADYLDSVEEAGCGVSTRNHRRSGIRSFYKYAAKMKPMAIKHYNEISKVPVKKVKKKRIVSYMSEAAVKAILAQPDTTTEQGMRDQFFMVLLYSIGARINEMMRIEIKDVHMKTTPTITIQGKGNKVREVPLLEPAVQHYLAYKKIFHPGVCDYSERPLFYTEQKGTIKKMHPDTARKFIYAYGVDAKVKCKEVPDNVHPHLWRHTCAMHLYRRGMDLTLISQWLGHSKLETTLIYAYADTEQKRKAIEKAFDQDNPLQEHVNAERYVVSDEELLKRLYGLR